MPNDFAGLVPRPGESTDVIKTIDTTPAPPKPEPPKPPAGWDKLSYKMAYAVRKLK